MSSKMRRGMSDLTMSRFMVRGVSVCVGICISIGSMIGKHPYPNRNMFMVGLG